MSAPLAEPLSAAALAVLARAYTIATGAEATPATLPKLAALRGTALIFPSRDPRKPFSDMALSAVVRRMNERPEGVPPPWRDADGREAVPPGFRSSFRTGVDDTRPEDAEAAEKALAHEQANKVVAAYARSDLFDRRRPLMEGWAAHCTGSASATRKAEREGAVG